MTLLVPLWKLWWHCLWWLSTSRPRHWEGSPAQTCCSLDRSLKLHQSGMVSLRFYHLPVFYPPQLSWFYHVQVFYFPQLSWFYHVQVFYFPQLSWFYHVQVVYTLLSCFESFLSLFESFCSNPIHILDHMFNGTYSCNLTLHVLLCLHRDTKDC